MGGFGRVGSERVTEEGVCGVMAGTFRERVVEVKRARVVRR